MTVFRDALVELAVVYVGVMMLLVLLLFLIVEVGDRRLRKQPGDYSGGRAALEQCGFTNQEIARLVHYRDAVRAGYFTDQIHAASRRVQDAFSQTPPDVRN